MISRKKYLSSLITSAIFGIRQIKAITNTARLAEKRGDDTALGVIQKTGGPALNPQTEADRTSESIIIYTLNKYNITRITAEESMEGDAPITPSICGFTEDDVNKLYEMISEQITDDDVIMDYLDECDVYVDPLDGTIEFTQGSFEDVTTLVGVSHKHEPVGGVLLFPFSPYVSDSCKIIGLAGLSGLNYVVCQSRSRENDIILKPLNELTDLVKPHVNCRQHLSIISERFNTQVVPSNDLVELLAVTTRNHSNPFVDKVVGQFTSNYLIPKGFFLTVISAGGAGSKLFKLAAGVIDAYIYPRRGTKFWDTCAGDYFLKEIYNTRIFDSDGNNIDYANKERIVNSGTLCTISPKLSEALRSALLDCNKHL